MLKKFYENVFDVELYCQMADLIYRLSEHKNKNYLYNELESAAIFLKKPEQEMEEAYGFRYPGEVLERLDEKADVTERQLRALGLALQETTSLQNEGMFIGKQKPSFWKRMKRTMKPSDLYWLGIQYLTGDGGQQELYGRLLDFPVQSIEEMVFILSLLPDDQAVWEKVKGKLNLLLGKERKFSVYTHVEIYAWLTMRYHIKISGYHKKDIETLKYLFRLPFTYAKDGSLARKKLVGAGYTVEEIMFLSMSLLYQVHAYGVLKKKGLTAERMAVETCMLFLSGNGELPGQAETLCVQILNDYRYFEVRLEDTRGIFDRLYQSLKVESVNAYRLLLANDRQEEQHDGWFLIDLTDTKWQELYSLIERDSFDKWVFKTLCKKPYTKEEIKRYVSVYENLTGKAFYQHFWNTKRYDLYTVFSKMSELELVHPLALLEEYLKEHQSNREQADKKWKVMADYLNSYMKGLQTPKALAMLFRLEKAFGTSSDGLFSIEELLWDSLGIEKRYGKITFFGLDLIRPFLNIEEHQQLFYILEQHIFKRYPDRYIPFLTKVLSIEDNLLWFPKEDARDVFLKLEEVSEQQRELDGLRKLYLTEEELERANRERKEKEERNLLMGQIKKKREIRKKFTRYIAKTRKTEKQFAKLRDYVQKYYTDKDVRKQRKYITKRYLCSLFQKNPQMLLGQKETEDLCGLAMFLFTETELSFSEMREMLEHIEIREEAA